MVDANERTRRIWQRLQQLRQRLLAEMESGFSALAAMELTVPQSMALFRLIERGPLSISQLQPVTGRSQAATSHLITQLERRKLVTRKRDSEDARRTLVHATPKALKLVRQVEGLRKRGFDEALAAVPASVMRQLDEALAAVLAALEDRK
jgi:DNA-binding MarR family transcriptional regulator